MARSTTEDFTRSSDKRDRSSSRSTIIPLHFSVHKPGCHFESCCGICNLFPGVLLIAFCQVLVGAVLLTLILTHGKQYDEMHQTSTTQFMSIASGAVLSGVTGAGLLLIVVALTENCRAMLIYLLVAAIVWMSIVSLAVTKIGRSCVKFKDDISPDDMRADTETCNGLLTYVNGPPILCLPRQRTPKIKDEEHRLVNLACVSGLFTFLGAVFYFFSFVIVFSFYHFRYVRRAILLHEAMCE